MDFIAKFFQEGGPFMYIILFVSAFAVAVMIERAFYLYFRCRINAKTLLTSVTRLVRSDKVADAGKLCKQQTAPLAVILESALWHFEQGLSNEEIQNAVDETALRELPRIQKRIHYLGLLANVATLLGLLGTITGLMSAFNALAAADPAQKATLLALGISQAMNTTALGLIVGIPCLVAFSVLSSKASATIEEIDESSVRLLNFLFLQRTNR
ncbi:MAG: MotA/TolQ/ExbB proton channel family protein [Fibrobacteres bacterium]|nr:MotA/TolQ/ExbB proton channel family protein [Fibrobacterota bacterium]